MYSGLTEPFRCGPPVHSTFNDELCPAEGLDLVSEMASILKDIGNKTRKELNIWQSMK